jgi:anti-sigma B factor antagonist
MAFFLEFLPLSPEGSYDLEAPESYAAKMTLRGSMTLQNTAEVSLFVKMALKSGVRRLLINMENLSFVDSSGIGLIFMIRKLFKAAGGLFALLNVPPKINEAFDLVNLKEYIPVFYSEDKALEHFKGPVSDR